MKIYIAGPISGKGYDEVMKYFKTTNDLLSKHFEVFCPLNGKGHLRNELEFKAHGYDEHPISTNHAIIERDRWMVDQSDVIYANLTESGERVSIGTCMELAWGHDKGKHTIVAMNKDNIHRHAFVLEAADIVFETHKEAMEYLRNLGSGKLD